MAISVAWYDNTQTILVWVFPERWTWEDYGAAQQTSNALADSVAHIVDVIGDLTGSKSLPPTAVNAYRNSLDRSTQNLDLIVLVGSSSFIRTMVSVLKAIVPGKVAGANLTFADSIPEAYSLIHQRQAARSQG
jgi:hypothetical protein